MVLENCLESPVSLKKIKNEKILSKYRLILKEDICKKGLLLLRSGFSLSEELIDKLINFGIFEISVFYQENNYEEEYLKVLKRNFLSSKNVYIIDKNLKNSSDLINILADIGFERKNIFTLASKKSACRLFNNKKPDYLIFDYETNSDNLDELLKNIDKSSHIFVFVEKNTKLLNSFNEFNNKLQTLDLHCIIKTISPGYFLSAIYKCIDSDFNALFNRNILD